MTRAKCRLCKQIIDTRTAYRVTEKNGNAYYCNIEHYETKLKEFIARKNLVNLIYDLLNIKFDDGGSFISKRLKELNETYTYEHIYRVTEEISLDIQFALENLKNNGHKMNYMFVMIKNKLFTYDDEVVDYTPDTREVIKAEDIKLDEPVVQAPRKRKQEQPKQQNEVDFEVDF